jgi:CheY-like chemotaxis protein
MIEVLYVEDDASSRAVLHMLERLNPDFMHVTTFNDSEDFERRLAALECQPAVILLDIHVRPYNGFEMLKMVRASRAHDCVPVVAVTASVMNEEVDMLRHAGFEGTLAKPLDLERFPSLLQRILNGEKVWHVQ